MMNLPCPLVSTEWLLENIENPNLIIFDTSVHLAHKEGGGYLPTSGRENFIKTHIPGAQFIDLIEELSCPNTDIPFTMPDPTRLADILKGYGVDDQSLVILYNDGIPMWSTRAWWMIRSIGLESVSVLDGGWKKWHAEGKPVSDQTTSREPSKTLTIEPDPSFWADKDIMLENIDTGMACTINALSPEIFSGEKNQYGRPGHIPGSHNVFYGDLINQSDGTFVAAETVREKFELIDALGEKPVIAYCGGGISATMDAMMLFQLGKMDVAVYDGSMSEWIRDPNLPLNLGEAP
jgi:thiosulfate/3-mercaptopyruvate sulfurtransferase